MNSSSRPVSAFNSKRAQLPSSSGDLEQDIQTLYEHQKACEKSGKYLEAEAAKRRLLELKKDYEGRSKHEIVQRHQVEREDIEKVHLEEFNQFNEYWDSKMAEFEEEANKFREQVIARHQEELKKFQEELEESIPQAPKDSAELLALRKTEEQLAKQEQYMEAHQIQQRIYQLQSEEYEKWNLQRSQKIRNLISQIKQKQQNEFNAVLQRIASGQDEQRKVRSLELEKLLQRYNNVCKEIESQHHQEITRLEKSQKNQSVMQQSRMNQSRMQNSNQKMNEEY